MGWRGTLRSINAAGNRAQREAEKRERSRNRSLAKVDRNSAAVIQKARTLQNQLSRDPIKALELRYSKETGFTAQPLEINTDVFSGSISLLPSRSSQSGDGDFVPRFYHNDFAAIRPIDILVTQWATFIAFKVGHKSKTWRMKLNWMKKSEPSESSVYLVDQQNNEYYFPIATDLKGDVVPDSPRVGILAFEPFRMRTEHVELHFSNVKISPGRASRESFTFTCQCSRLAEISGEILRARPLVEQIAESLEAEESRIKQQIERAHSGCAVMIALAASAALTAVTMVVTTAFSWLR